MIQLPSPPGAPLPPEQLPVVVDTGVAVGDIAQLVAITIVLIGAIMLLMPLGRALARRIEGRAADPALADEIAALRERAEEFDQLNARVHELEERLDFAERLLVQRDSQALPTRDSEP